MLLEKASEGRRVARASVVVSRRSSGEHVQEWREEGRIVVESYRGRPRDVRAGGANEDGEKPSRACHEQAQRGQRVPQEVHSARRRARSRERRSRAARASVSSERRELPFAHDVTARRT